ncbi:serine hydrolase FSH [Aspergillus ambiguus]|uniref:serine hydrolase FSH n=1 Tax=Aspergillus ambiguus TaxID=176160 RepID=UPI003CCCEBC2
MKILCLHGTFTNAETFKAQIGPLTKLLEKPGVIEFEYIDGFVNAGVPAEFQDYYGSPPYYRWFDNGTEDIDDDPVNKFKATPEGLAAEDAIRTAITGPTATTSTAQLFIEKLFNILEADPEITGLLAYSEGAILAATTILEEHRRLGRLGRPRQIKHAVFISGWPPVRFCNDGFVRVALADECDEVIDVPTCHVIGCNDPYIHGAMALFSLCDEDTATLFDHGKGHTVPRDGKTLEELASAIRNTWTMAK